MRLYHASLVPTIHQDGLHPNCKPICCNKPVPCVYLGSLQYLEEQYFEYCPKGVYYIFEVDTPEDHLEHLPDVKHYRYWGSIDAENITPHSVQVVS